MIAGALSATMGALLALLVALVASFDLTLHFFVPARLRCVLAALQPIG